MNGGAAPATPPEGEEQRFPAWSGPRSRVLDAIMAEPWAITRQGLAQILLIAQRSMGANPFAIRLAAVADPYEMTVENGVALLPIRGSIFPRANLFTEISGAVSAAQVAADLKAANADPMVDGIVLAFASPGGQMAGVSDLRDAVAASPKPVLAHVEDQAASAAYWIASGAEEITMSRGAWVGSIGSVLSVWLPEEEDVLEVVSSQSPLKIPDAAKPETVLDLQRQVDAAAQLFIDDVALGRKTSPERVQAEFGRGGMVLAADAIQRGMADRLATLDETLEAAAKKSLAKEKTNVLKAKARPVLAAAKIEGKHNVRDRTND